MLKKSEEKTNLIILNYNNYNHSYLLFNDNSKGEYDFKKILKNKLKNFTNKKWKSLTIFHTNNNFILIPEELYIKVKSGTPIKKIKDELDKNKPHLAFEPIDFGVLFSGKTLIFGGVELK